MWNVWLNGAWQQAADDAVVISWIQQGYVRPDTPVMHASWSAPSAAGSVPAFQAHWHQPSASRPIPMASTAKARSGSASNIIVIIIVAVVAWAVSLSLTAQAPALGFLLLCAGTIAIALIAASKFWSGAPPAVRSAAKSLRGAPAFVLAALFASPFGASLGLIAAAQGNKTCREAEEAAVLALNDAATFQVPNPLDKLRELKADIAAGRSACELTDDQERIAKLDEISATLERQANAAVCAPLAEQALATVNAIGESLEPQARLQAFTTSSAKFDEAIAACDRAGGGEVSAKLTQTHSSRVVPGIAAAKAAIKAAEEAKARAAIEAATVKVPIRTFLSEYRDNEIRADALYKGKLVQVTGRVSDTKRDILNNIFVTLGTGRMFEIPEVQCFFENRWASAAAQLSKGQTITVRGRVDGLMFNVLVKNCEILEW